MTDRASTAASLLLALCTAVFLSACGGGVDDSSAADDLTGAKKHKCTSNASCSNGQVCVSGYCAPCTSSSQCSNGQVCTKGVCTTPSTGGCTTNSDCPAGDVCVSGTCQAGGGGDGTPTRTSACTPLSQETGTIINTNVGRLDGIVTYVVPLGGAKSCNGDSGHIHVQVSASGHVYDVAVDVGTSPGDAELYEADLPMTGAWSEGWHGSDTVSYPAMGVTASLFTPETPAPLAAKLEQELAAVNHISVYGTAYSTHNGCHDVHYHGGNGLDGALVLQPLSATPHWLFFKFATQTY